MKIEGPSKTAGTKGVSKTGAKKGAGDVDFGGMVDDASATSGSAPASGVMAINNIEALLSVQEDGTSGNAKKHRERGEALLDELEKLRISLLTGGVPQSVLTRLGNMISGQRDKVMDPQLNEILDEIDLRVQVELAKHDQR